MKKTDVQRLFKAIELKDESTLNELLDQHPEAINVVGCGNDFYLGKTPLMYALQCGNLNLAKYLVSRGADIRARSEGASCLSVLQLTVDYSVGSYYRREAFLDWVSFVEKIVDAGDDPNDCLWSACYHYDQSFDRIEMVELLLAKGADPDRLVGNSGNTVRELIRVNSQSFSPRLLALFGLQTNPNPAAWSNETSRNSSPILEHPDGTCRNVLEALVVLFRRLENGPDNWVVLSGQGQGGRLDSYYVRDVRYRNGVLDVPFAKVDAQGIVKSLKREDVTFVEEREGRIAFVTSDPKLRASFMDALFQLHFHVKPFEDTGDYCLCVEAEGGQQ